MIHIGPGDGLIEDLPDAELLTPERVNFRENNLPASLKPACAPYPFSGSHLSAVFSI